MNSLFSMCNTNIRKMEINTMMVSRIYQSLKYLSMLLLLVSSSVVMSAGGDIELLGKQLNSADQDERIKTARHIYEVQIKDKNLFELVNKSFLMKYENAQTKLDIDEMAWLARYLSISGNPAYLETLEQGFKTADKTSNQRYMGYIEKSLKELNSNIKYRAVLNNAENYPKPVYLYAVLLGATDERTQVEAKTYLARAGLRTREMSVENASVTTANILAALKGDNAKLVKQAAIHVHYGATHDHRAFEQIKTILENSLTKRTLGPDVLSWLLQALAASGDLKYLPLLEKFSEGGKGKLHIYASRSMVLLHDFNDWHERINTITEYTDPKELYMAVMDSPYIRLKMSGIRYLRRSRYSHDDDVIALAFQEITTFYPYIRTDKEQIISGAGLLRILSETGDKRYLSIMSDVQHNAPSKHMRKQARKYQKYLMKINQQSVVASSR